AGLTTDQRGPGFPRFTNGTVTIGAFQLQPFASTTTLTSAPNPSTVGQAVTFTATVAVTPTTSGAPTPQGTVTFTIDGAAQAPVPLTGPTAVFTTPPLAVGSHTVTATYNGFALGGIVITASASATLAQVVNATPPPPPAQGVLAAVGADAGGGPQV